MALMKVLRFAVCAFGLWMSGVLCPAFGRDKVVNVYGWSDFIDPKVIEDFTTETGIKVTYDTYPSDEGLEARLAAGQTGFDVAIVSGTRAATADRGGALSPPRQNQTSQQQGSLAGDHDASRCP